MEELIFKIGDKVQKIGGDYFFKGTVIASFHKLNGKARYCVENSDGLIHIFNGKQLYLGWVNLG